MCTLFNLVYSFLLSMSCKVLEFISKFQIVFEKRVIFRVWTYIVILMEKEYLLTFKRLKEKRHEKKRKKRHAPFLHEL